ncbi:MAG: hypothetical protein M1821_006987 [Bathelium mastoideum]|nr:MAG: hypothetical protein M1821_006987 [Bathelium mastoideum]
MSQWNASNDFWTSPGAALPPSSTAQTWDRSDTDERERAGRIDASNHAVLQSQSDLLQWQPELDVFSERDMYAHNASFSQPGQGEPHPKAPKMLGDMYSYPYSQPAMPPQQPTASSSLAGLDAYAPLPRDYQNFLTGPAAVSLPASGNTFHTIAGQQDAYNLGQWSQNQHIPHQQIAPIPAAQNQYAPLDTTAVGREPFDVTSAPLSNEFNFQFNDHSLPDLNDPVPLGPPTLRFHAPDLTGGVGTADYNTAHLPENFAMPSTESYHGYTYDPNAVPMGDENIGLAIAGPPPSLLPQDSYPLASITPGISDAASSFGKSLSPRTNDGAPHRGRIPSEAKAVLEQHFEQNAYPTKDEVEQLANQLNLKPKTVKNWFGNTRQRRPCSEPTEEPAAGPVAVDGQGNPIPTQLTQQSLDRASLSSAASSIERFEKESFEDGPVSLEAIERAAPTYKTFLALNNPEELAQSYIQRTSAPRSVASSAGDSTGASSTSGASGLSSGSAKSATSLGRAPRRGRRRYRHNPYGTRPGKDDGKTDPLQEPQGGKTTKYHCTWCFARFARPYEWKRHQETLHVPRQVWVCTPGAKKDELQLPQHADEEQLNPFSEWKGEAEQLPPESRALWCGFCRRYHSTWEKRVKDVARHFGDGEELSTWWDPDVGWLRPSRYKSSNLPLTVTCRCCKQPKTFDNQQDARRHYESTGEPWQLELDLTRVRFHTREEVDKHRNYMSLRTAPKTFWSCYQIQDLSGCITPAGTTFQSPRASPASPAGNPAGAGGVVPLDTCNLCGEPFAPDADPGLRLEHLEQHHGLRACKQTKFYDLDGFRSHLKHRHRAVVGEHTRVLERAARCDERDPPVRLERSPSAMEAAMEMQGLRSWSAGSGSGEGGAEGAGGGRRPKLFNALSGVTKKFSAFRKGAG